MLLRYVGNGNVVSFIKDSYYEARKIHDELGDGYAIFDEGDDWYSYDVKFVENNFEKIDENDPSNFKG